MCTCIVGFMDEQMMGPGGPGPQPGMMPMRPPMMGGGGGGPRPVLLGELGPRPLLADPGHMHGPPDDGDFDYDGPPGPMMMDGPRGPGGPWMQDGPRPLIGDGPMRGGGPMHGPRGMRPNMMRGGPGGPGPVRPLFCGPPMGEEGLSGLGPDDDYEINEDQMIPGLGTPEDNGRGEGGMGGPGNMSRGKAVLALSVLKLTYCL